jgi:hypothetical protein
MQIVGGKVVRRVMSTHRRLPAHLHYPDNMQDLADFTIRIHNRKCEFELEMKI